MVLPNHERTRWHANNQTASVLQQMEHSNREIVSAQAVNAPYRADACSRLTSISFRLKK
jgi:hypothetical protein